jgi:DNA-binding beta-propeller fold protein YncE/mono/diheme cytochrome c family protein
MLARPLLLFSRRCLSGAPPNRTGQEKTMFRPLPALTALLAVLSGCSGQLDDNRFATGSNTLVGSADFSSLHVVDTDGGSIATVSLEDDSVSTVTVGLEPTRIARAGNRIYATLRGERSLAVLEETDSGLILVDKIATGAEPIGVVASEDGEHIYVASSLSGLVSEIATLTLETTRSWAIENEPRWLALHPSGKSLYVASVRGGTLTRVDLGNDQLRDAPLPEVLSNDFQTGDSISLTPRITGDPAVSPDGKILAIPVLYVDNISEVEPPDDGRTDEDDFMDFEESGAGYGGPGKTRFHAGVVNFPLNPGGVIDVDGGIAIELTGLGTDFEMLRSYPSSVVFSPDGNTMVVSLEGASAVLSVKTASDSNSVSTTRSVEESMAADDDDDGTGFGGIALMDSRSVTTVVSPAGPRGVAFVTEEQAFVHSFLDRTVTDIRFNGFQPNRFRGVPTPFSDPMFDDALFDEATVLKQAVEFAAEHLPANIAEGRRLFYSSDNPTMAAAGAGVSCATCHFDGRNDGLTWSFEGPGTIDRQTPSLAGVVSITAPLTWTDNVGTVVAEVMETSQGRMGGNGLSLSQGRKIADFIDWTREADVPLANSESDAVVRGREIFHRSEVGCSDCHNGIAWTDNETYDLYGLEAVRTPSLVGIAATAPYLHDGAASSIPVLLSWSRNQAMGDTSSLSQSELGDLAQFVLSL